MMTKKSSLSERDNIVQESCAGKGSKDLYIAGNILKIQCLSGIYEAHSFKSSHTEKLSPTARIRRLNMHEKRRIGTSLQSTP